MVGFTRSYLPVEATCTKIDFDLFDKRQTAHSDVLRSSTFPDILFAFKSLLEGQLTLPSSKRIMNRFNFCFRNILKNHFGKDALAFKILLKQIIVGL